jgi:DNA/RNA non-specific endonuclease
LGFNFSRFKFYAIYRTGNVTQIPTNGKAWIENDWTAAIIVPSDTEYAKRLSNLPMPHGGKRSSDQKGHIIGHALGGSDSKTNNFFAQDARSNKLLYNEFEKKVREELSKPCVAFIYYFVQLQYPKGFRSPNSLPLRPKRILPFAIVFDTGKKKLGIVGTLPIDNP